MKTIFSRITTMNEKILKRRRAAGIIVALLGLALAYFGLTTSYEAHKELGRLDQMILK